MKTTGMLPLLGLTALGALFGAPAGAANATIDEAASVERADLVFAGVVERVEYAFSDAQGGKHARIPHTFVTYRIEEVMRGHAPGETITLRFIGGRGEEASFLMVSAMPLFDVGDRDVMFVSGNTQSGCPLVGCAQGRLRLIADHVFNDEGQAIELDADGRLALGAYYDVPEVMTHKVSQTTIARRDHFEQGESRQPLDEAFGSGSQVSANDLMARLRDVARTTPATRTAERSADVAVPFTIATLVAEPAPAERARPTGATRAVTAQERAELEAVARSGGNPVLDTDVE